MPGADAALDNLKDHHYLALAFQAQADQPALALCRRYLTATERDLIRAISLLERLRANRQTKVEQAPPAAEPPKADKPPLDKVNLRNEPTRKPSTIVQPLAQMPKIPRKSA